jgi:hypothetical protein
MSPRALRRVLIVLPLFLSLAAEALAELPASFTDVVRNSGFIFQGTVKAPGRSTPTVPTEPRTAIVVVNRILEAPAALGNVTGREVTVRFRKPGQLKAGESAVFFTYVYSAGTSLGLDEVGWLSTAETKQAGALESRVRAARQELADEALSRRLASAVLVVVATSGEPRPTEQALGPHDGEHDPLWWAAPIRIESVEKGQPGNSPAIANFPKSIDVLWERSPRLKEGQKGIFLLQPPGPQPWFRTPGLFLVDPLDLQGPEELERVRRLLKAPR